MHKNVGKTDALIRITGGLLGLAYGIGRMSRRPYNTPWLLMSFSAMKVAEGVTRFCPMYAAMGINSHSQDGMRNIVTKVKEAGMQAGMNAVMKQVTHSMDTTVTKEEHPTSEHSQEGKLSADDRRLENAVREFVSYSADEHRYPTYS